VAVVRAIKSCSDKSPPPPLITHPCIDLRRGDLPVPNSNSKISRSRAAKGLVEPATTAFRLRISASVSADGSLAAAGADRINRAGFSLIPPDSTQKAKKDRRADLVRLMVMGLRGRPSGAESTVSLINNRAKSSGSTAGKCGIPPQPACERAPIPRIGLLGVDRTAIGRQVAGEVGGSYGQAHRVILPADQTTMVAKAIAVRTGS